MIATRQRWGWAIAIIVVGGLFASGVVSRAVHLHRVEEALYTIVVEAERREKAGLAFEPDDLAGFAKTLESSAERRFPDSARHGVDPWDSAFVLERDAKGRWSCRSAGPDRKPHTWDDIVIHGVD